jgi:ribosomal protein S18 acetylase RimI-like enzyme
VAIQEMSASGLEYLTLVTELLQRARLADAEAGIWEAADLQWWWRKPRQSDAIDQLFWLDREGPVAALVLTDWGRAWGCDPIIVPGISTVPLPTIWARALGAIDDLGLERVEVLARDNDAELLALLADAAFVSDEDGSGTTWMQAADRPKRATLPEGFELVDRRDTTKPHPMQSRNGEAVEARLQQCSLYDPTLDLAVDAGDQAAGYALFWFDPVTEVGLVEPMRVEEEYQRRGLARALLTAGLDRLAKRGARRLKVGYATEPARALYTGAGFRIASTERSYAWTKPAAEDRA